MADPLTISIIIATRNREAILWQAVEMATIAAEGRQIEIVIVNDGDNTLEPPIHLQGKISCYRNPGRGVSVARNFGVAKSSGTVLFFVDDDMWIDAAAFDWISRTFSNADSARSVYNLNWEYPPSLTAKLRGTKVGRYLLSANYHTMWGRMHKPGPQPSQGLYPYEVVGSGSLVMTRTIFDTVGGYNEAMIFQGEDIDMSQKLQLFGFSIFTVFDVTLFHNHQDRLGIDAYLQRESNGYKSQFNAVRAGLLRSQPNNGPRGGSKWMYEIFANTEKLWLTCFKILPNHTLFNFINNKFIGALAGLQRYKHWRKP